MLDELKAGDWDSLPNFDDPMAQIEMTSTGDDDPEPLPWIDLSVFRATPGRVIAPAEVVLDTPVATLLLDYPMDVPAIREIRAADGKAFTRAEMMAAILSTYEAVYDSERLTQSVATPPQNERGALLNRPASDGVFGVAMHDLDDLGVSSVEVYNVDGIIWVTPVMES